MDGLSFNLGKLINVGFDLYRRGLGGYSFTSTDTFLFHPVDCMPIEVNFSLGKSDAIILCDHSYSDFYGKSFVFSNDAFEKHNGYANWYWGWGLEDNDLFMRFDITGTRFERRKCEYEFMEPNGTLNNPQWSESVANLDKMQKKKNCWLDGLHALSYKLISKREVNGVWLVKVAI